MNGLTAWPAVMPRSPWPHQHEAYDRLGRLWFEGKRGTALFSDMGTGKTLVATALIAAFGFARTLIVCPKSMVTTWPLAIERETASSVRGLALKGTLKQRADQLRGLRTAKSPTVVVTNYEGFWQAELGEEMLRTGWDCVILDESQRVKAPGSKASMFAARLGKGVPYRLIMTGTPLHDTPLDVYGQYRFIDPTIFGTRFDAFREHYAWLRNGGKFVQVVGHRNLEELSEKMYSVGFRVEGSVLKLPDIVVADRFVDLERKSRKAYDQFERDLVLELETGTIVAGNVLVKLLRLQQIACGHLPELDEEGTVLGTSELSREKTEALEDVLEDLPDPEPLVVFARYTADLDRIAEASAKAGRCYFEQSGRADEWRHWQFEETEGSVLGVQMQAGNAGIELYRANRAVMYSTGYSLGDYAQALKRLHRPGQNRPVSVVRLIARGTVDEAIAAAIEGKRTVATFVSETLRKGRTP